MGKHHTADERARIIATIRAGLEDGISVKTTAHRMGITQAAFYRWVRMEAHIGGQANAVAMRAVTIMLDAPARSLPPAAQAPLSLMAPSGHRIEGLTIETAAALLRALA